MKPEKKLQFGKKLQHFRDLPFFSLTEENHHVHSELHRIFFFFFLPVSVVRVCPEYTIRAH